MKPPIQDSSERGRSGKTMEAAAPVTPAPLVPGELLSDLAQFQQKALALLGRNRGRGFCLMLTYIDAIRGINETLGHAMGAQLLQDATQRVRELLGAESLVGNLVDGYVAALIPVDEGGSLELKGEMLTRALNATFKTGGTEVPLTASTGAASFPQDGDSLPDLFRRALMALSYARRRGGNRYRAYEPVMGERVMQRWSVGSRLRGAMQRDEFKVMYQPHVDPVTGLIVGAEALMRWRDGEHGPRSPAQFVPLLEEASLIVPVGLNVMRIACSDALSWINQGHDDLVISVNLSPRQIDYPRAVSDITAVLEQSGLPASSLVLEITEGMILRDVDKTRNTANALTLLGVRLVLDDFGTGYAALSSLRYLPLWGIKLDRAFVMGLPDSHLDVHICEVVIDLARRLKLHLIAEGVETPEQLQFMRERGVRSVQGYFYSPAVSAERFGEMLRTQPFKVG